MSKTSFAYRPDIDGLRAVAVLSVLLFHIDHRFLPGGFSGVDIFFVISGYLITSIIARGLKDDSFSFQDFYVRRLRRIQPVLWLVIAATLAVGMLVFLPSDLKFLADSIRSTLSFTSNFFFARESDYFNPVSSEYPLLHTWSLAVEEQFYFVWPALLFLISRVSRRFEFVSAALLLLLAASFGGAEWVIHHSPGSKFVYFMLPSRMGELIVGGWLGILQLESRRAREFQSHALSLLGLILVIAGFVTLDAQSPFPGLHALIPCLGAAFIIAAGERAIVNRWLSLKPVVYIGGISYSLYLWHYPILAYAHYLDLMTPVGIAASLLVMFALSDWSKRAIEDHFRKADLGLKGAVFSFWLKPAAIALAIVVVTYDSNGLPQRYFLSHGSVARDVAPFYDSYCHQKIVGNCIIGAAKLPPKILLYGDSHAGHYMPFWDMVAKERGFSIMARSSTGCHAVFEYPTDNAFCTDLRAWFKDHYRDYKTIILGERWEALFDDEHPSPERPLLRDAFRRTLKTLTSAGIHVVVLAQVPKFREHEYNLTMREKYLGFGLFASRPVRLKPELAPEIERVNERLKTFVANEPGVTYFSPVQLVPEFLAEIPYRHSGMAYKDGNHLNEDGAKELASLFLKAERPVPFLGY